MVAPCFFPCLKEQLDLFTVPPVSFGPSRAITEVLHPTSNISAESAPIDFFAAASSEYFTKLSETQLEVNASVITESGTLASAGCDAAPVNNVLHSLFEQVEIYLGKTRVSSASLNYAYKAYMETVLNYDGVEKDTHLSAQHFYRDNNLEGTTARGNVDDQNTGFVTRNKQCARPDSFTMIGKPHCDLFNVQRLLIPGVSLRLRFVRSPQSFVMMHANENYKIKINSAALRICRVSMNESMRLGVEKALDVRPALYPMIKTDIKVFHIPEGKGEHVCENLFHGTIPRRLVFGLVENHAYNGKINKNPFNFNHYDVKEVIVRVDGNTGVMNRLKMDYEQGQCAMGYMSMFLGRGGLNGATSNGLSINDYKSGYAFYSFDLTPTKDASNASVVFPPKKGNVTIKIVFSRAQVYVLNAVVMCESDATIMIDKNRDVTTDFSER